MNPDLRDVAMSIKNKGKRRRFVKDLAKRARKLRLEVERQQADRKRLTRSEPQHA